MNGNKCKSCGAAIRWVRVTSSRTGKEAAMPVDDRPSLRGNILIDGDEATVLSNAEADEVRLSGGTPMFLSHFATCPNAARHRSKS